MRKKIMSLLLALTMVAGTPAAAFAGTSAVAASTANNAYLDNALAEKKRAEEEEERTHAAYNEAASKKTEAANALQKAQKDEAEKKAAYDLAMGDAEQKKNEAEADYQTKESEYQAALQTQSAAQTKVDETAKTKAAKETAYQDAQAAYSNAKKDADAKKPAFDEAQRKKKLGSYGFFENQGATTAMACLTQCNYHALIKTEGMGASAADAAVDATSLDNMEKSFQWIRRLNVIRKEQGLQELRVTHAMMAMAQADADYSDTKIAHAVQFPVWENVAWNYGSDPYRQWYDNEKAVFDAVVKKMGGPSGLSGKAAYDYYNAHEDAIMSMLSDNEQVGHYINDINPDLLYTGFAVCTRGTMNKWKTYAQVFHVGYPEGDTIYTIDEYEKLFKNYKTGLEQAISSYNTASVKLSTVEKGFSLAESEKKKAEDAFTAAAAAKTEADTALVEAQESLDTARAAKESASAEYNSKAAAAAGLLANLDQAKTVTAAAQSVYDKAEEDRKKASDIWKAARIRLKNANKAYSYAVKAAKTRGKVVTDKQGVSYESQGDGTAIVKGVTSKFRNKAKKVSVPAFIKIKGVNCKVTEIGNNAFSGCRMMAKVTIGKYVTCIGSKAFYGCSRLKNIVINSSVLIKAGSASFAKIYKTVTVKVPAAKKTVYRKLLKKAGLTAKAKFV